jgi:hypothetical protein
MPAQRAVFHRAPTGRAKSHLGIATVNRGPSATTGNDPNAAANLLTVRRNAVQVPRPNAPVLNAPPYLTSLAVVNDSVVSHRRVGHDGCLVGFGVGNLCVFHTIMITVKRLIVKGYFEIYAIYFSSVQLQCFVCFSEHV